MLNLSIFYLIGLLENVSYIIIFILYLNPVNFTVKHILSLHYTFHTFHLEYYEEGGKR